jgi:predicted nucleic acid-binding protein
VAAARLYRVLVSKGCMMPPGDVAIAALAIQHHCEFYTLDLRHVERISAFSNLRLHQTT